MEEQKYYGMTVEKWNDARREIKDILINVAKRKSCITYQQLTQKLTTVSLSPSDYALFSLLGELSTDEHRARRPLLSALVVTVSDNKPGQGFFDLARSLGYMFQEDLWFWTKECNRCYDVWK